MLRNGFKDMGCRFRLAYGRCTLLHSREGIDGDMRDIAPGIVRRLGEVAADMSTERVALDPRPYRPARKKAARGRG